MTALFMDTLFLGLLTYLAHSTIFLALGLIVTSVVFMKNHSLKELILRFALFGALITTPLHMTGAFEPIFQPINIPEETVKSVARPLVLNQGIDGGALLTSTQFQTTITAQTRVTFAGQPLNQETENAIPFTLANIVLMIWALIGAAFLIQLIYLIIGLKVQLSGRVALEKGRAIRFAESLAKKAGIPTPSLSTKKNLAGPFCLGTGEIVLPEWVEDLPNRQLKAMIAHEVAHIMRADPAWILGARVVQSIFFFQPLNIIAARRLSELSEFACDAWAGTVCGSGMPLAECLAECAKRHIGRAPSPLGAAMANKCSSTVERTQLLLAGFRDYSKPASTLSKVAVLSTFIIGGTMIPVFAFDESAPEKETLVKVEAVLAPKAVVRIKQEVQPAPKAVVQVKQEVQPAPKVEIRIKEEAVLAPKAVVQIKQEVKLAPRAVVQIKQEVMQTTEAEMLAEAADRLAEVEARLAEVEARLAEEEIRLVEEEARLAEEAENRAEQALAAEEDSRQAEEEARQAEEQEMLSEAAKNVEKVAL